MAFIKVPGIKGKIYVQEEKPDSIKKYRCTDCHSCQMCSDSRCKLCLARKPCNSRKPSKKRYD